MNKKLIFCNIIAVFFITLSSTVTGPDRKSNQQDQKQTVDDKYVWIIFPNGGEILSGNIIVSWHYETLFGLYHTYFKIYCVGESITYTLSEYFESIDENISAVWNTTILPDGKYKLKVELWGTGDYKNETPPSLVDYDYSDDWFTIDNNNNNNAPNKPSVTGDTNGAIQTSYNYTIQTTDPDQDEVKYFVDWGDNTNSGWLGPYPSGQTASASHSWNSKGNYLIKVKARDEHGLESKWANLTVTMPYSYNKLILPFLELLFQRFPHAFPILRQLMGY